jgi:hypothetical protein
MLHISLVDLLTRVDFSNKKTQKPNEEAMVREGFRAWVYSNWRVKPISKTKVISKFNKFLLYSVQKVQNDKHAHIALSKHFFFCTTKWARMAWKHG